MGPFEPSERGASGAVPGGMEAAKVVWHSRGQGQLLQASRRPSAP